MDNPFANLRRLITPTFFLDLPEIPWRPVFALELEYDGPEGNLAIRNERFVQVVATKTERTELANVTDPKNATPEQMRALLDLETGSLELDRKLYPGTIIRGWRNPPPGPDGQPLAFTAAACAQFLDPANGLPDWLFERVRAAAKNRSNFPGLAAPAAVEAASGNS